MFSEKEMSKAIDNTIFKFTKIFCNDIIEIKYLIEKNTCIPLCHFYGDKGDIQSSC